MESQDKTRDRTISIAPEVHEKLLGAAKKNGRTIKGQVAFWAQREENEEKK